MKTSFDTLLPKLRESLSRKNTFDPASKRTPIQEFRYVRAMHSCAATAKLSETSGIPFFQNLANSFAKLGQQSNLSSTTTKEIDFVSEQILKKMDSRHVNLCEEILIRFTRAKKVPGKLRHLNQLIEFGEFKSVEAALATITDASDNELFSTSQKLLRAKGMVREAEEKARKLYLEDPDCVVESGEPPKFLFNENGGFPDLITPFESQSMSANSVVFHCRRLIVQDRIIEAVQLALDISKKAPLPKRIAILIAAALGRLDLSSAQRAELQAIQELPLIPLQIGTLEPKDWFPNSIQRAARETPSPSDSLLLSSWGVSLLSATNTARGQPEPAFSSKSSVWQLAVPFKPDPFHDALLGDGYKPVGKYANLYQFPIADGDIYEGYMSASAVARAQTKRAKKFLQEAAVLKSGTVLFSIHASKLSSRDTLPTIAAARLGMCAISFTGGMPISSQNMLPKHARELSQLPVRVIHRSAAPSAEITNNILTNLRKGGILDIAIDLAQSSGKTAMVPWLLRPISVPTYPAALAISLNCKIGISATWVGPSGELINDIVALELPAEQGDLSTRALWLLQKAARSFRDFAKTSAIPISSNSIGRRGGTPKPKNHVPLVKWSAQKGTAPSLVNWLADTVPDQLKVALRTPSDSITFDRLQSLTLRMASVLLHYQTEKPKHCDSNRSFGDQHRIMLFLPQGPAFISTTMASLAVGSMIALSQDDLTTDQLIVRFREFKPDLMIITASAWARLLAAAPDVVGQTVLIVDDRGDDAALGDLVFSYPQADQLPAMKPNAAGIVIFTSGSTGKPKGVVHLCDALAPNEDGDGIGADVLFGLSPVDKLAYLARWDSVCFLDILSSLRAGTEICIPAPQTLSAPSELSRWLKSNGVTCFAAPSTVFRLLLQSDSMSCDQQPDLRLTMPWGERISDDLSRQLYQKFPNTYHVASYGASEALWVAIGQLPRPQGENNGSTVCPGGLPISCVELALVDDAGSLVTQGETGNPRISGPSVMLGYLDDLLADNEDPSPSPVILKDFARLASDGSIELQGRSDSIIKIAGRRISLLEIEAAAELAAGAYEALAFVSNEAYPPQVVVAVVGDNSFLGDISASVTKSITTHCFTSARPDRVVVFENFPRLPSGKRDRKAVELESLNKSRTIVMALEKNTKSSVSFGSPLVSRISRWAALRLHIAEGEFDLNAALPPLDSLMVMELMLIIEEVCGPSNLSSAFNQDRESKWADLVDRFDNATKNDAVTSADLEP